MTKLQRNIINVLVVLVIGTLQMVLAQVFGIHDGLEHMVYTSIGYYIFEAAFYAFAWFLMLSYSGVINID